MRIAHALFPTRDAYPFHLRVVQETATVPLDVPVTFFAGENGSGNSTLLRALAQRCNIHIWENSGRTRARHNPHAERLCECIDLRWRNGSVPGSFFAAESFRVPGLYLHDEPESALSPRRQVELLRILSEAASRGDAQFVVATHSPILMSLPGSRILSFDASPVAEIAYRDTDSFRLHEKFFDEMNVAMKVGR